MMQSNNASIPIQQIASPRAANGVRAAAEYLSAARRGRYLLVIHAPQDARRRRAHALLNLHGAHTVHYFGRWIVRGLPCRADTARR